MINQVHYTGVAKYMKTVKDKHHYCEYCGNEEKKILDQHKINDLYKKSQILQLVRKEIAFLVECSECETYSAIYKK